MDFAKIRPRGGTKAQWETANPVLGKREMGIQWESEIGVGKVVIKFGNGVTAWNNLDTAVEVENDLVNKIISSIVTVSDEYPILNDGDSLSTLVGKIKKYIQDLKDKKLDKSARYDGTDSTSTELVPTANALRGVNAKADKNASDITTLNNNLSKCVKVNPAGVRSVEFSNGYPAGRYFDISVQQLDDKSSTTILKVDKDTLKVTTYENNTWTDRYTLATKSDLSSSQNLPYVVTCTNAIDQSLFSKAQFKARRTENGTGAAAYGFENVGTNSGALYLDPSDYKLHFINYDGKKFIINWTAEN